MLKKYVDEKDLLNLKKFRYTCKNDSILYNNITSPLLDRYLLKLIPIWLAPNLISVLSFLFNFVSFVLIFIETGGDFDKKVKSSTCIIQTITHILYILLDNLDGKQARRTGSSSPLGLLIDHGLDSLTTCIVCYNISHILLLGNGIKTFIVFCSLYFGFWCVNYEEYFTGEIYFGHINGADEGNMFVTLYSLLTAIYGVNFWKIEILYSLTLIDLLITFLVIGTFQCSIQCIVNCMKKKGIKSLITFLYDSKIVLCSIVIPYLFYSYENPLYSIYNNEILGIQSLLFSRITIECQINIVCNKKSETRSDIIISVCLWIISFFVTNNYLYSILTYFILCYTALNLLVFICITVYQIKNYLGIKLFTINPQLN